MKQEEFNELFRRRTKKFASDVIIYCNSLPQTAATRVIVYQLVKSSTSVAANYRAACRARSRAEFYSKMSIVVEEADESQLWLEIINDAQIDIGAERERLEQESLEIVKVCAKARSSSSSR